MDALAAEIAKKRKQVDGAKGGDAKRRWVRTADLQQQRRKDIEESAARKPVARPVVVEEVHNRPHQKMIVWRSASKL